MTKFKDLLSQLMKHGTNTLRVMFLYLFSVIVSNIERYREATLTHLKLHDQLMLTDHEKHAFTCCVTLITEQLFFAWNNQTFDVLIYALQGVMILQPNS
jgi:hypothetical protein